ADGHVVWMHNDQWEGQRFNISPNNLYSDVKKVHLDNQNGYAIKLSAKNVILPIKVPPDTKWVKRIKFQSKLLSKFWGQPIYLGANILLPKGYDENLDVSYPIDYIQGHFSLRAPYGFRTEIPDENDRGGKRGYEFYQAWASDHFPRMILVTFQHPCPYFDDSYAVNSANCGPYGDAILTELIPEIESRFRVIREPYARILEGGSTGGWEALALQIYHPDFFGGVFAYCPDPVDFSNVEGFNIYKDKNAYYKESEWLKVPTISVRNTDGSIRITAKQKNYYELVRGTKGRSGEQFDIWSAVYGPVGEDGYFKPLYDKVSGEIDPEVAQYWKENYDLRYYLEKNWATVGPKLIGKLHIFTGDMDTFYLNNAVHLLQDFMEKTENPHYEGFFWYASRKPHCWTGPFTPAERIKYFAVHIAKNTRRSIETTWWKY
ncbi:MAG: alpha/beta hydrolase-fold protein, partial [bacterium]